MEGVDDPSRRHCVRRAARRESCPLHRAIEKSDRASVFRWTTRSHFDVPMSVEPNVWRPTRQSRVSRHVRFFLLFMLLGTIVAALRWMIFWSAVSYETRGKGSLFFVVLLPLLRPESTSFTHPRPWPSDIPHAYGLTLVAGTLAGAIGLWLVCTLVSTVVRALVRRARRAQVTPCILITLSVWGAIASSACDRAPSAVQQLEREIEQNDAKGIAELDIPVSALDAVGSDGYTPLGRAAAQGKSDAVAALLAKGANPNAPDVANQTALMRAWRGAGTSATETLLKAGASPNLADARGNTAPMIAAMYARPDLVTVMLRHGANLKLADAEGKTALHWVATVGSDPALADLMIKSGADPNAPDRRGTTPLMSAAAAGQVGMLKVLLTGGADLEAKDVRGETALWCAVSLAKPDAVKALLESGDDPNAKRLDGSTVVSLAMSPGREACLKVFRDAGIAIPGR
jgi:ankyrin repeat protein